MKIKRVMGRRPSLADINDYTIDTPSIKPMAVKLGLSQEVKLPVEISLVKWCSPVEDQGDLGSCCSQAAVGLVEYFERKAFGNHLDASRLFVYYNMRKLIGQENNDSGADLRNAMGAIVLFGAPPEKYWPYDITKFNKQPEAFHYSFADNFRTIQYFRLDPPGTKSVDLLKSIKTQLAAGIPSMFGFTVYDSIDLAEKTGEIPFPKKGDKVEGGHAIMVVGHNDNKTITASDGSKTTGALLIRNSWGIGWGIGGYGWLPYEYVLSGLADDFWVLIKNSWVDTGVFGV